MYARLDAIARARAPTPSGLTIGIIRACAPRSFRPSTWARFLGAVDALRLGPAL